MLIVPWSWLALFLAAPLVIVCAIALLQPADAIPPVALPPGFDALRQIAADPLYAHALLLSLKVAAITSVACLLIGYPMALAIARAPAHRQPWLLVLVMLPFWTGFLMRLNSWIGLLQDQGLLAAVLHTRLLYTDAGLYCGMVYTYVPFMILPLYARLSRLDPALIEAAADLGASPFRAFLFVVLPLSLPGVRAGLLLVFIPAIGEYVVPELLGGPQAQLLGRVLWEEFFENRDWPTAASLAVAMLALMAAAAALAALAGRMRRR